MCNCDFLEVSPVAVDIPLREEEFENLVTVNYSISNENDRINWSSSDENVLEVVEGYKGRTVKIRTKSLGMASVLAKSDADTNMSDSCLIEVVETLPASRIDLNETSIKIRNVDKYQLNATIVPWFCSTKNVVWASSDTKIATVDSNGLVSGKSKGTAIITATAKDTNKVENTCRVEVVEAVNNVQIKNIGHYGSDSKVTAYKGLWSNILKADIQPITAENRSVKWTCDDSEILNIDENTGAIYGKKAGTATVKATSLDKEGKYDTITVVVKNEYVYVEDICLNSYNQTIEVGEAFTLKKCFCPVTPSETDVEWVSENPKIATVNPQSGRVVGQSPGKTKIWVKSISRSNTSSFCTVTVTECNMTHQKYAEKVIGFAEMFMDQTKEEVISTSLKIDSTNKYIEKLQKASDWCDIFVRLCLEFAGVCKSSIISSNGGATTTMNNYRKQDGVFVKGTNEVDKGDIVFFTKQVVGKEGITDENIEMYHMAFALSNKDNSGKVETINGNWGNPKRVLKQTVPFEDTYIYGYVHPSYC